MKKHNLNKEEKKQAKAMRDARKENAIFGKKKKTRQAKHKPALCGLSYSLLNRLFLSHTIFTIENIH